MGQNKLFLFNSVKVLRNIKYCAIVLSGLNCDSSNIHKNIFALHAEGAQDDDRRVLLPCPLWQILFIVVATMHPVFEKTLQSAAYIKSENDLTV
ncbi:MAG: DUF2975 domain-containing protein [Thermodesulfobacteriota bacterium]